MSKSIDGYLILGWEVEVEDAANFDYEDGLINGAEERVTEILGKNWIQRIQCDPIVHPSLYYECEYMYVGLVLMNSYSDCLDMQEYARHLEDNAELFTKTAYDLYAAIMGKDADTEPKLLCVACEG